MSTFFLLRTQIPDEPEFFTALADGASAQVVANNWWRSFMQLLTYLLTPLLADTCIPIDKRTSRMYASDRKGSALMIRTHGVLP